MKEKILNAKKQYFVTFAAIALVGWGILLLAVPVSAADDTRNSHSMATHFRRIVDFQQHKQHKLKVANLRARRHRSQALAAFLGISQGELKKRVENGESIHAIAAEQGKTKEDFRAFILDYMQKNKLRDNT